MKKSIGSVCALAVIAALMAMAGCKGGGSAGSGSGSSAPIAGVDTPASISVVSANNAN